MEGPAAEVAGNPDVMAAYLGGKRNNFQYRMNGQRIAAHVLISLCCPAQPVGSAWQGNEM